MKKEEKAEFIPEVTGDLDLRNFDNEITNQTLKMTKMSEGALSLIHRHQSLFKPFNK